MRGPIPASGPPLRVSVVGSSRATADQEDLARRLGALLATEGAVVVTGGLGGVMAAASRGAREAGGLTLGLLPGTDATEANAWVEVAVPTGMGEGRNVLVVRAAEVVVAVGGAWGTLSEVALARAVGLEVVLLGDGPAPGLDLPRVESPEDASSLALDAARRRRARNTSHR